MTNSELEKSLKALVAREREILHDILEKIAEVDRRKLFLARGYPNLFEYLTGEIGLASASAQRRIDAVRLSHEVPEVILLCRYPSYSSLPSSVPRSSAPGGRFTAGPRRRLD